jgi:hypothetical protein
LFSVCKVDSATIAVVAESPLFNASTPVVLVDRCGGGASSVSYTKYVIPSLNYDPFISVFQMPTSDITSSATSSATSPAADGKDIHSFDEQGTLKLEGLVEMAG